MITELTRHHDDLVRLCRRFGVTRLDVFGSAVSGEFDPTSSDVDFLVEIDPPAGSSRFEAYFGFKEAIEALLGRPVDLVDPSALTNPYFAEAVERTRKPLCRVIHGLTCGTHGRLPSVSPASSRDARGASTRPTSSSGPPSSASSRSSARR